MFDIGIPEFGVLALVAVFVFGPDRLPDLARQAGRFVRTTRQLVDNAKSDLAEALDDEPDADDDADDDADNDADVGAEAEAQDVSR